YLRLVGSQDAPCWDNRGHFFAAAAEAMRRLLVENARRKQTEKRGGGRTRVAFEGLVISAPEVDDDLVALDEALTQLTAIAPQKAELVKLRYFVGLTIDEAADLLGVSPSTAKRYWIYGRAWLYRSIAGRNEQSQPNR
ncbi:MAG TPA: ECF-type sigma factor, partial [Pirellulales bacterium]